MKTIKKISNCFLFHSITIIIIYSFLTLLYYFNIIDFSLFSIYVNLFRCILNTAANVKIKMETANKILLFLLKK